MKDFSVEIVPTDSDKSVVLKPAGSINTNAVPTLQSHLDKLIKKGQHCIVVDLSNTDFISSSGIGVFIGTVSTLRKKGGDLILMNIPELIKDIFDVLNMASYFRIVKNLDEVETILKS